MAGCNNRGGLWVSGGRWWHLWRHRHSTLKHGRTKRAVVRTSPNGGGEPKGDRRKRPAAIEASSRSGEKLPGRSAGDGVARGCCRIHSMRSCTKLRFGVLKAPAVARACSPSPPPKRTPSESTPSSAHSSADIATRGPTCLRHGWGARLARARGARGGGGARVSA
jgi:hypothetical protein